MPEGTTNHPLLFLIMNRVTGQILASLNAGGGDQVTYEAASNRYYEAASRWTATGLAGLNGACTASTPCMPVLMVVDGSPVAFVTFTFNWCSYSAPL